ncbi:MAG: hypothetical protein D6729_18905, partial [Deltaproteobacteria bacterium]
RGGGGGGGGGDGGTPKTRHYTFRAIAGVSMGGIGSGFTGATHPEAFDLVAPLGGAFDVAYMLHYVQDEVLSGFCRYEDYLALLEEAAGDTEVLNDPARIAACKQLGQPTQRFEHGGREYNDWWFDDNGGTFDRSAYLNLFEDLTLALGNPGYYNPESPQRPPGMTGSETCEKPLVIRGLDHGGTAPLYNAEYNPEGRFDVISFCDGEEPIEVCEKTGEVVDLCRAPDAETFCGDNGPVVSVGKAEKARYPEIYDQEKGRYDPCRPHTQVARMALAVDYDGDGVRDYGEPIVNNGRERFRDVGSDGCANEEEDGQGGCGGGAYDPATRPDPNGDDYDWETQPLGTEGNWRWDEGEPFDDFGLDGVAGTGDYGEGNGTFDRSPNYDYFLAHDPRSNYLAWDEETFSRVDFYFEGGIRDIFNFGVSSANAFGALAARRGDAAWYLDFASLPRTDGTPAGGDFDFQDVDFSAMPGAALLLYGDPDASPAQIEDGDGAHVGTVKQALDRFNVLFSWISSRWPDGDYAPEDYGSVSEHTRVESFWSESLQSMRSYAIALPPGYFEPANANKRYPVVYFLHGYGQAPEGMLATQLVLAGYMAEGLIQKMIIVFVDGRCCFVDAEGHRDCDEPPGKVFGPEWTRECNKGSFYVNRRGRTGEDTTPYMDSIFDLIAHVESKYRTKPPADLPRAPERP